MTKVGPETFLIRVVKLMVRLVGRLVVKLVDRL